MQISRPSSAVTPSATSFSRPSSSSIPTFSRPSSAESFSRQTLTTPIPEVLVVAENLNSLKYQENLSNYQGILNPGHQQNVDEYQGTNKSFQGTEGKYQVGNVCNESYLQKKKPEYKQQLKRKIREKLPDEWDLESTSSLESNLFTLNDNLRTISHLITKDDSTEKLFQLEPKPHSKSVTCIFATCYFLLGATIVIVIVMTVLYDFGMLMLLCLIVTIFIIIVIVTNICVIVYQQ